MTARPQWIALAVAAQQLGLPFARALALVRANVLRARFVPGSGRRGSYWVTVDELRRFVRGLPVRRAA